MKRTSVISFPHMGDYHVPIGTFFQRVFPEAEVRSAPPSTKRTAALGARHSPDFICEPFKYNMGNYLEALEDGATMLLQTGTGCRYGYYGELQEQILRDLGHDPAFLCLSRGQVRPDRAYRVLREFGSPKTMRQISHAFLVGMVQIRAMDRIAGYIREHIAFAKQPEEMREVYAAFLDCLPRTDSLPQVYGLTYGAMGRLARVPLELPQHPLRVGIVGDLYTVMEPFSNCDIEKKLTACGIMVSRRMSVSFLFAPRPVRRIRRETDGYLNHHIGANGADSVAQSLAYAKAGYDGILHVKSFGCTPELNAIPAMQNIGRDYEIPILHLSFDTHQGETGVDTRLEAFVDMIARKRR